MRHYGPASVPRFARRRLLCSLRGQRPPIVVKWYYEGSTSALGHLGPTAFVPSGVRFFHRNTTLLVGFCHLLVLSSMHSNLPGPFSLLPVIILLNFCSMPPKDSLTLVEWAVFCTLLARSHLFHHNSFRLKDQIGSEMWKGNMPIVPV